MPIPQDILDDMKIMLLFAQLVEECQDKNLITSDERVAYITTLNNKVHTEIEKLLALLPPEV